MRSLSNDVNREKSSYTGFALVKNVIYNMYFVCRINITQKDNKR